ncbi:MAG: hypothetical protein U9Q34_02380 [Elusimicrobiota bacterium]|nr:hypothetical protein [Elusimicrobiota bacterium]
MGQALSGKLYLTGFGGYSQSQDYTAVRLKLTQSNTNGSMSGYYTGRFNSFLSFLRVDDTQNIYDGEGFAISSFSQVWERRVAGCIQAKQRITYIP